MIIWCTRFILFNEVFFRQVYYENSLHEYNVRVVVFYATFNNISVRSWQSVLFVEETGGPGDNYRPVATDLQTLSHTVVSSAPRHSKSEIRTRNVIGDRIPYDQDHDDYFA